MRYVVIPMEDTSEAPIEVPTEAPAPTQVDPFAVIAKLKGIIAEQALQIAMLEVVLEGKQ